MNWAIEFATSTLVMDTVDQIGPQASIVQQPWVNVSMALPKQWEFSYFMALTVRRSPYHAVFFTAMFHRT